MLSIYQQNTPTWTFTITYSTSGSAVDLTGSVLHFICKDGSTTIFDITCDLADDPKTGICTAKPTSAQTKDAGIHPVELSVRWTADSTTLTLYRNDLEIKSTLYTWS